MSHVLIYAGLFVLCSGYALVAGSAPERIGAAMFVIGNLLSALSQRPYGWAWQSIEVNVFLVDLLLYFALGVLAIRADRFWPIWMAGLQGVSVIMHIVVLISPDFVPGGYYALVALGGYPMAMLLAVAAWRHRQRVRQFGAEASWRRLA